MEIKNLLILLSLLCCVLVGSILVVEVTEEEIALVKEQGFGFDRMFAYFKYYLSELIGFLFRVD